MIYFGSEKMGKMYLGTVKIGKAYLGDELVYDSAGGRTPRLPDGYTEVSYVRNTGNAYLVTPCLSDGTTFTLTAQALSIPANSILIGRSSSVGNYYGVAYNSGDSVWIGTSIAATDKVNMELTFTDKRVDGVIEGTTMYRSGNVSVSEPFTIFTAYPDYIYPFYGNVYADVVAEVGGTEVFRGVPCSDPYGVAGLYDIIGGAFIAPARGTLIAGPEV